MLNATDFSHMLIGKDKLTNKLREGIDIINERLSHILDELKYAELKIVTTRNLIATELHNE